MSDFSTTDCAFMARAIGLARQGRFTAHPNPMVGCVLVNDGEIVGEGWHEKAGSAHAEIHALRAAGMRARGATAYVTLEPCVHHGKTPPCADALVEAGVSEVVVALEDPFPKVRGNGRAALEAAGIVVRIGLMQSTVEHMLAGYLRRVVLGRPFVRLKLAASLDGRVAMASGQSQWITGPEARSDVQRLRAAAGAVMTGVGTVLADDPSLTVRDAGIDTQGRQPVRVVLDSRLRMPRSARMLALPGKTLIYCSDDTVRDALIAAGAEVIKIARKGDVIDVAKVLESLAKLQINDLLVEAGPGLAGGLVAEKLVDELVIYQAPHIMGSETIGMFLTPLWTDLGDRQGLDITDVRRVGRDTRITARFSE